MKPSNYAPAYCALYPELATIAREHGYAMAIHGTLNRDMDLICVPWTDEATEPMDVVNAITGRFAIRNLSRDKPEVKKHGRLAWTISIGHGECALDLSFVPRRLSEAEERRRFHEFAIDGGYSIFEDGANGVAFYISPETDRLWEGWQGRRDLLADGPAAEEFVVVLPEWEAHFPPGTPVAERRLPSP